MKHYTKDGKQIEIAGHIVKPDEAPQAYEILKGIDLCSKNLKLQNG